MTKSVKTKQDLIEAMVNVANISKRDAEAAFNAVTDTITSTLNDDGEVTIIGWGSFKKKRREAREGLNPQTKEKIQIPAKNYVHFKGGKKFLDTLNCS